MRPENLSTSGQYHIGVDLSTANILMPATLSSGALAGVSCKRKEIKPEEITFYFDHS